MEGKKPWYKSKIMLLVYGFLATIGTNLLTGFLTGQGVTPDQLEAVRSTQPEIADAVSSAQSGQNVIQALWALSLALIGVARLWFTKTVIG